MTVTIHSYQDGKESVVSAAGSFTGYWMDETKPEKRTYSVEINIPYVYRFCDFHTVQSPSDAIVKEAGGHYLFGKVTACEEDVVFLSIGNDLIMIVIFPDNCFQTLVDQNVSLLVHKIELYRID